MQRKYIYYLLKAIQKETEFNFLINNGFTYSQITVMIIELESNDYIKYIKSCKKFVLTSKGYGKIIELSKLFKGKIVLPLERVRIKKIDKNYIYVPDNYGEFKPG
jgi:hypothetical protein